MSEQITATNREQVDGTKLVDDTGIDQQQIDWRKDFTNLEQVDVAAGEVEDIVVTDE